MKASLVIISVLLLILSLAMGKFNSRIKALEVEQENHGRYINDVGYAVDKAHERINEIEK